MDLGHEREKGEKQMNEMLRFISSVKIGSIIKSKNKRKRFWRKCSFRKENDCGGADEKE